MRFRLNTVEDITEAGEMRGMLQDVACGCWFTKNGKSLPKLVRAMDSCGCIHTMQVLEVLSSEDKRYSGIDTVEHICKVAVSENQHRFVKLIFSIEGRTWKMVFL